MKKTVPVLPGLVCLMLSLALPAFAARQKGKTLADLPPAAQMAVSAALGRDNAVYHAVKIADGYSFVLPETFQSSSMPKDSSDVTPAGHPLSLRGGRMGLQERSKTVASFNKDGAVVSGWRLSLAGIGRGDTLKTPSSAAPVAKGNRIEYRRGAVTEWYVNGPLGLEQGFTLDRAPEAGGTGPITLAIKLPSHLKAEVGKSRTDVVLTGRNKAKSLRYGNLVAWDATGRRLEAWFELSPVPAQSPVPNPRSLSLNIHVNDKGARYPITIDPFIQQQELTASDAAQYDYFGDSVSLSSDGNTALIGAYNKNSGTGATYVFVRSGTSWTEQQELTGFGGGFGGSVSLSGDGNTALIGAYWKNTGRGAAYVFVRSGTSWTEQQELTASDAAKNDNFGGSVSLSGDGNTALIGAAWKNTARGAAYLFVRSGTGWSQQQELTDGTPIDTFGGSVSLSSDGSTALIGAPNNNSVTGVAYVFVRSGESWIKQQKLIASDAATEDAFGGSVSLSGDGNTALIGADWKNSYAGAAYVFVRSVTGWSQQQELTDGDSATKDQFGYSVSLSGDGNTALIGADRKNSYTGAAYVFVRSGTIWSRKQELTASDAATKDRFGWSVSLSSDGGTALIGADQKNSDRGAAYMFPNVFFCSDGYHINGAVCSQCGAGTYQIAGFNSSCIPAPSGTYVSGPGASSPTPCAAGTYQNQTGQTSCLSCSANTYQPATGQTSCFAIPKAATSIIIDPSTNPATVYAGIDTAGVYKSTDNTNWAAANGTGPNVLTNLRVKALARSASGTIYAGTYGGGVFKTTDGGANWTACGTANMTNLNVVSLAIDPTGKPYAGTEAGVFVSSDGCATWTAINNGLPN